jgi:anti-sigma-K factor RskA
MNDIHALSGAYAIDALDDLDRARFEHHLAGCAECRAEVDSLRETAALLADTTAAAPPASLRARVLDDIDTVRPLPPVVPTTARPRRGRRRVAALVAAAAALVAIGGVGATVWHPWSDESSRVALTDEQRVLLAEDSETWTDRLDNGATITVTRSASLNQAVVRTDGLEPAGADRVYQLWLQQGDEFVSAGLMAGGPDATVLLEGDPASAVGFGITREPAGGSDKPTRPPISLIELENA